MEKDVVTINKKTSSNIKSIEVSGDIIVPDIKPDIVNVIDTNGNAFIYKEEVSNGKIRLDGNIDTYIVYLSDSGENRSIQTTLSFAENIESSSITEKCFSKNEVTIEKIESKVLNERKLSIKVELMIKSDTFEKSDIELPTNFNDVANIQELKNNIEIKSIVGENRVKTSIKEELKGDNSYSIAEILKTSIEIENIENKISYNKVLAKADANVKVIFLSEDGRIGTISSTIPVMSFIDIDKISDQNTCSTEYAIKNMLYKVNSKDMNSVSVQVDFEVYCEVYDIRSVEIIEDMYSTKNEIDFTRKDVEVQINTNIKNEITNINEKILVEDIINIYDASCSASVVNTNKSGSFYNYECELKVCLYYEADNRNGLNIKHITFPFIIKFEKENSNIDFRFNKKQFTINNENVDCNIEIEAKQSCNDLKKISLIQEFSAKPIEEEEDYKMYMYFVKSGDSIWKIAKKFKVCMDDIIGLNNLENPDKINVGDRLYIMR